MAPLLYSIAETAKVLGIGRSKTYELIEEGRLKTVYLGARRLVKVDSVEALVEGAGNDETPGS